MCKPSIHSLTKYDQLSYQNEIKLKNVLLLYSQIIAFQFSRSFAMMLFIGLEINKILKWIYETYFVRTQMHLRGFSQHVIWQLYITTTTAEPTNPADTTNLKSCCVHPQMLVFCFYSCGGCSSLNVHLLWLCILEFSCARYNNLHLIRDWFLLSFFWIISKLQ